MTSHEQIPLDVRTRRARAETYRLASENVQLIKRLLPRLPTEASRAVFRDVMEFDQRLADKCVPAKLVR
jgi:hypothetical protein